MTRSSPPPEQSNDINGVTDPFTTNQDIDFTFDGFGVVGSVVAESTDFGPAVSWPPTSGASSPGQS